MLPIYKAYDSRLQEYIGSYVFKNNKNFIVDKNGEHEINIKTLCQHTGLVFNQVPVFLFDIVSFECTMPGIGEFKLNPATVLMDNVYGRLIVKNNEYTIALVDPLYENIKIEVLGNTWNGRLNNDL